VVKRYRKPAYSRRSRGAPQVRTEKRPTLLEGRMRKLGFGFASIGMLMLVLLTGMEPIDEAAFWIHAGLMYIGVMTIGLGVVLMRSR
jgi:hypothetical protein